jgi:hypothetical protein
MTVGANGYDEGKAIVNVSYTHDSMIDLILAEPEVSHIKLAEVFGYSQGWISRVIASDAFQARMAERKAQLVDPTIAKALDDRLKGLATQSLEIVAQKLSSENSATYAMEALGLASRALGYGARPQAERRGGRR